ncbi:MAG: ATP-binding cassette domain-containing protein, partial [Lachnospiraceae bacterium]|nr:ATP-binding cassette domain-containing protein [Lachnospiraceae bacterium]
TLPYASQSVDTLSGGIRQRVFLAMILAQNCDTIVLDEPSTYLDLSGQRKLLSLISSLRDSGKTVILVLHDLAQAVRTADWLVVMQDRKIAAADSPENCLQQHIIQDVFDTECTVFEKDRQKYYVFS